MKGKMTKKHKDILLEKLCPFILRDAGHGFCMSQWRCELDSFDHFEAVTHRLKPLDGIEGRRRPACGTTACLGGSLEIVLGLEWNTNWEDVGAAVGLNPAEADALFFGYGRPYGWPPIIAQEFKDAKTPLAKAEVAVKLVKLVVETEGECLHLTV